MADRQPADRPPSIYDVARRAGVSYQTVSRVINASPLVSERLRNAVLSAIRDLDFHPSSAARAFSTGVGSDLAVVVHEIESYGWSGALAGIQSRARELGLGIALHDLRSPRETLSWLKSQTVRGTLILGGSQNSREVAEQLPRSSGVVGVGDRPVPELDWVVFEEFAGSASLTGYLFDQGHRRVDFVTIASLRGTGREDGWRYVVRERNAAEMLIEIGDSATDAYEAGKMLASRRSTAVLCANDQIAIPVMAGLRDAGRIVPELTSVAGFDDHPMSAYVLPSLTTVRQDFHQIGAIAVDRATRASSEPTITALPVQMIVRGSTGPPPHWSD